MTRFSAALPPTPHAVKSIPMALRLLATAGLFLFVTGCSSLAAVTVIDCTSGDVRHILRIHTEERTVDDLASTPPTTGTAEVSDAAFVLRFKTSPSDFQVLFRIDRVTGDGTRKLIRFSMGRP